jgi:hypothetical protein
MDLPCVEKRTRCPVKRRITRSAEHLITSFNAINGHAAARAIAATLLNQLHRLLVILRTGVGLTLGVIYRVLD